MLEQLHVESIISIVRKRSSIDKKIFIATLESVQFTVTACTKNWSAPYQSPIPKLPRIQEVLYEPVHLVSNCPPHTGFSLASDNNLVPRLFLAPCNYVGGIIG